MIRREILRLLPLAFIPSCTAPPVQPSLPRQPGLGAFFYPGGTTSADWPLTPVALIDGAPFRAASGRIFPGGQPELASSYLEFVLNNCDWTSFRYRRLSRAARMAACQSLLRS